MCAEGWEAEEKGGCTEKLFTDLESIDMGDRSGASKASTGQAMPPETPLPRDSIDMGDRSGASKASTGQAMPPETPLPRDSIDMGD